MNLEESEARPRAVILAELRELTILHVRPEWQPWALARLHSVGSEAISIVPANEEKRDMPKARAKKRKRVQLCFPFALDVASASAPFSAGTGAKGARKRAKLPPVPGHAPTVASPPPRDKSLQPAERFRAGLEDSQRFVRSYREAFLKAALERKRGK